MAEIIKRKVYFYRLRILPDEDDGTVRDFSPSDACTAISRLHFLSNTTRASRYMVSTDDAWLAVWPKVPKTRSEKARLGIGTSRHKGLPTLDDRGAISHLAIGATQNVLETTHIVFFENNIVGAEFNFHGPRVFRLSNYLAEKFPSWPRIRLHPLLNQDAQELLNHMEDTRFVRLRVNTSNLDLLPKARRSLKDSLEAQAHEVGSPVIEVAWRQSDRVRQPLPTKALNFVRSLVGLENIQEVADIFQARGLDDRTDRVEMFDFLKDKLVFSRQVTPFERGSRAVDATSMYSEIEIAYNQHREDLERAGEMET